MDNLLINEIEMLALTLLCISFTTSLALEKDVHAFYYLWYGNPATDGKFLHWDHEVLPHWTPSVNRQHAEVGLYFDPEHDNLHSPFYPSLGAYSSLDPDVIRQHFRDLQRAKVSVLAVSWWGQAHKQESTDNQGVSTDRTVASLLALADETHANQKEATQRESSDTDRGDSDGIGAVSVCFHMEPYPGRSAQSTLEDLQYIHDKYGHHPSLARRDDGRVIFYIYDSYHISASDWADIFSVTGKNSIRRSGGGALAHLDSFVLGLWLDHTHGQDLATAGFDGFYTYFAADGFSYGSTTRNWPRMCAFARTAGMVCSLSVGPGYQDDKIRPWNGHNTRPRREGGYYDDMWRQAVKSGAEIVSITSFNEWGEGTQIEPVRQHPPTPAPVNLARTDTEVTINAEDGGIDEKVKAAPVPREYLTYGQLGSYGYIDRTAEWATILFDGEGSSTPASS